MRSEKERCVASNRFSLCHANKAFMYSKIPLSYKLELDSTNKQVIEFKNVSKQFPDKE